MSVKHLLYGLYLSKPLGGWAHHLYIKIGDQSEKLITYLFFVVNELILGK